MGGFNAGVPQQLTDLGYWHTSPSAKLGICPSQVVGLGQTVDGVPTHYTLDIVSGLTQVLSDGTNAYLYGQGRIGEEGAAVEYFLGDALSSVRQLVDSTAEVKLIQSYEPFGSLLVSEGEGESVFQYTGEARDTSNLTYLRSRYYSSMNGRFINRDTWAGITVAPMTYNAWLYVNGNPVNNTDPSGYFSEDQIEYFLGVNSWPEVIALFDDGGVFEGKWGWIRLLLMAEDGYRINTHDHEFHMITPLTKDLVVFSGVLEIVNGQLMVNSIPDSTKYRISDVIKNSPEILSLEIEGGLTYKYYPDVTYTRVKLHPERFDVVDFGFDASGIALDWLSFGAGGRLVNYVEVMRATGRASYAVSLVDFFNYGPETPMVEEFVSMETVDIGLDFWGLWMPIIPDCLGILANLGRMLEFTP